MTDIMLIPLQPGSEKPERMQLLFKLASKFSDATQQALMEHYVKGATVEMVCYLFDLQQPNFARAQARLNQINHTVEQIKHLDLYHLTDIPRP